MFGLFFGLFLMEERSVGLCGRSSVGRAHTRSFLWHVGRFCRAAVETAERPQAGGPLGYTHTCLQKVDVQPEFPQQLPRKPSPA